MLHEESLTSKAKTQQKKLQASLQQLLRSVQTPRCPSYSAVHLLRALSQVNGQVGAGMHLYTYAAMSDLIKSALTPVPSSCPAPQYVLSALLPVFDRLLEQSGPDTPSLLRAEAQVMQLVLGKYNEASAAMLAEDQNCLDLFVRALRTSTQPHPDIPSCQIIALEQVGTTWTRG